MTIGVVGGGASGLIAAIKARQLGADVVLMERQARVGKKLLVTGNGRCNLTHLMASRPVGRGGVNPTLPYHGGTAIMARAMQAYQPTAVVEFFRALGVEPFYDGDRVYPQSEQAGSVVDALRLTCDELGVRTLCCFEANAVEGAYRVAAVDGRTVEADKLIMAMGGPSGAAVGGTNLGLKLMERMGFKIAQPQPALVQLRTDMTDIRALTGIRFTGEILIEADGVVQRSEGGEILFTDYGLSGPAVLQVSRDASVSLSKRKRVLAHLRVFESPPLDMLKARRQLLGGRPVEHFLTGLVNRRLGQVLLRLSCTGPMGRPSCELTDFELENLAQVCSDWPIEVIGTQGLDSAQVAAGGVRTDQFDPLTLEAKKMPGLYATGELLDIDGDCGGYNLQWAWASGLLAAESAAQ